MIKVLAHGCGLISGPENTLEGAKIAKDLGAHGLECDIRLTKDGEPICFHDRDTLRLTGVSGKPNAMSFQELRRLSVKGQYKIPHVKEILDFMTGWPEGELYLDFHGSSFKLAETIAKVITECHLESRVYPLAFYHDKDYLLRAREVNPKIQLALMPEFPWTILSRSREIQAAKICVGWDRDPHNKFLFRASSFMVNVKKIVTQAKGEGFEMSGGIANTRNEVLWFTRHGFDALWTDDVGLVREVVNNV